MKLFTVTVKIETEDDNGKPKNRKEHYLVSCMGISEAIDIVKDDFKGVGENWEIIKAVPSSLTAVLNYDSKRKVIGEPNTTQVRENVLS
jgi:hypothetical protein